MRPPWSGRCFSKGAAVAAASVAVIVPLAGAGAGAAGATRAAARPPSLASASGLSFERVGRPAVLPAHASVLGPVPSDRRIAADVVLSPRSDSALAAYAAQVSSPSSRSYRQYLSPAAFAGLFAPQASTVALVSAELRGEGLAVGAPLDDGLVIPVSAKSSTMGRAFRTSLSVVRLPDGSMGRFSSVAPSVPASIAPSVASVVGLDNLARPEALGTSPAVTGRPSSRGIGALSTRRGSVSAAAPGAGRLATTTGGPGTCAAGTAAARETGGYTPDQLAHAYGFDGLYALKNLGAGQTVDVFELEPFAMTDVATFDECVFGASRTSKIKVIAVDGGESGGPGSGEAALDVEEISALAPGADIDVYEAPETATAWLDEIAAIVAQDRASVVSTSWGFCESQMAQISPGFQQVENVLFQQAALEGQSWFAASGDSGSEGCSRNDPTNNSLSVSDPASQPYVTGVGGTGMLSPSDPPTEVVWNDGGIEGLNSNGASGGGISSLWQMPAWQSAPTVRGVHGPFTSGAPCAAAAGTYCREVPDVSASASAFHGDTVVYGGQWTTVGGTSAAAPTWAAVAALSDATCAAGHQSAIGFANPALYQIAANPTAYAQAFNDITVGNNDALRAHGGAYPATKGYDMATGLGSPRVTSPTGGPGLAALLCADGAGLTSRPVVTQVNPDFGSYQGGTTVTISGTDLTGVTAVNFGSSDVAVTTADVNSAGTQITEVTPAAPTNPGVPGAAIGGVVVTVSGTRGSSEPSPLAEFHFVDENSAAPVPSVSYVSPSAGPAAGGETVRLIGSGLDEGLAPGAKPTVEFGGITVPTADVTVISDSELSVVVPGQSGSTDCATAPAVPTTDICQVEVTVSNLNGTSAVLPILPALTGDSVPAGTELVAAPSEFDYAPRPSTTSLSPPDLPEHLDLSVSGIPIVTIDGTGFNFLTFLGVTFGAVGSPAASPAAGLVSIEPDELQVLYLGLSTYQPMTTIPVTIQTAGGSTNPQVALIPSVPILTSISVHAGPTTGRTLVSANGIGFAGVDNVEFFTSQGFSSGTTATVRSGTSLTFTAPAAIAGPGYFEVCDLSGCSLAMGRGVAFTYYEPVKPVLKSVSPSSGRAGGGGFATITGTGLGNVVRVAFGKANSPLVANPQLGFVGVSDTEAVAVIPPGSAGTTVRITLTTLAGSGTFAGAFTYKVSAPAAPASVKASSGPGSIRVSWTRSTSDGGLPFRHYVVSAVPASGLGLTLDVAPTVLHATLAPLAPGVSYRISVSSVNAAGGSTRTGPSVVPSLGDNGYLVASVGGDVAGFGSLAGAASGVAGRALPAPIVGLACTRDAQGYWLAGADGTVYALGAAHDLGSLAATRRAPVVGIAATPDGRGYWLATSHGGVFAFGDAGRYGSLAAKQRTNLIVGIAATPDGLGYWLVASGGKVFAFGDATLYRPATRAHLRGHVVAMSAAPDGGGYLLVTSGGGVFSYGDAKFRGSLAGRALTAPVTGVVATPDGGGYWLLGRDGYVHSFGDAQFEGDTHAMLGGAAAAISD